MRLAILVQVVGVEEAARLAQTSVAVGLVQRDGVVVAGVRVVGTGEVVVAHAEFGRVDAFAVAVLGRGGWVGLGCWWGGDGGAVVAIWRGWLVSYCSSTLEGNGWGCEWEVLPEAVITTSNCSRSWPWFVASEDSMLEPQSVHLKLVMLGGFGQSRPQTVGAVLELVEGLTDGSRSA